MNEKENEIGFLEITPEGNLVVKSKNGAGDKWAITGLTEKHFEDIEPKDPEFPNLYFIFS